MHSETFYSEPDSIIRLWKGPKNILFSFFLEVLLRSSFQDPVIISSLKQYYFLWLTDRSNFATSRGKERSVYLIWRTILLLSGMIIPNHFSEFK